MKRPSSTDAALEPALADRLLSAAGRINTWIKARFVLMLMVVAAVTASVPPLGLALKNWEVLPLAWGLSVDLPSLGLAFMMLSASLGCRASDFGQLVERPRGALLCLLSYYGIGPIFCGAVGLGVAQFFGGTQARELQLGLMLTMVAPIARTSAIWVQRTAGNMPLLLAVITLTTGFGVVTMPFYLEATPGAMASGVEGSSIVSVFVISVLVPLIVGMSIRGTTPAVADRWQPLFKLLGTVGLWIAVAANAAVAAPHLARELPLLIAMAVLTVMVNLAMFWVGLLLAKGFGLAQEDAIALVYGSGMRSNGTSLVIGLKAFPALPLVTFPSAVYILAQHALASRITRSINRIDGGLLGPTVGIDRSSVERRIVSALDEQRRRGPRHTLVTVRLKSSAGEAAVDLASVVARVRGALRSTDFMAKVEPDAIAVILNNTSEDNARVVAAKLARTVEHAFPRTQVGSSVTAIAGDAHQQTAGAELLDLTLRRASEQLARKEQREPTDPQLAIA